MSLLNLEKLRNPEGRGLPKGGFTSREWNEIFAARKKGFSWKQIAAAPKVKGRVTSDAALYQAAMTEQARRGNPNGKHKKRQVVRKSRKNPSAPRHAPARRKVRPKKKLTPAIHAKKVAALVKARAAKAEKRQAAHAAVL